MVQILPNCTSWFVSGAAAFFLIYASKLFEVVECHLPDVHAYADDNQSYISFKPGSSAGELEAVTALQDCILDIKTWVTANKLKLNDN